MRKITGQAIEKFLSGEEFSLSNTRVFNQDGWTYLSLFGNNIAKISGDNLQIRTAGYETVTTKERLNGLPGVRLYTRKEVLFLNDEPWEDSHDWKFVRIES